jgi:hypothetical protein
MRTALLIAIAIFLPAAATAESAAGHQCRCRYQGKEFAQGEVVCIRVGGVSRLARCGMNLNNSSWEFIKDGCPSAANGTPWQPDPAPLAGQPG